MSFPELLLTACALAMDAFAVSICIGTSMRKAKAAIILKPAAFFGVFQAAMPIIGYFAGKTVADYISFIDHWIIFALLGFIGGKMIYEAVKQKTPGSCPLLPSNKELCMMAVATSIDALAVGVSLAFMNVNIVSATLIIGIVTFLICVFGILIGKKVGLRFERNANLAGGLVLCVIGIKILIEHLSA